MTTALLIECTLKASLLFALAWAGTLALRRSSASARHALWTAALAAALAMPLLVTLTPPLEPLPGYSFAVTAATGAQAPAAAASISLVTVWLFPVLAIRVPWLQVLNLLLAPVVAGLLVERVRAWRESRRQFSTPIFAYAALFGLMFALTRWLLGR